MKTISMNFSDRYPAQLLVPLFDCFAIIFGGAFSYRLRFGSFDLQDRFWLAIATMTLFVLLFNTLQGEYTKWKIKAVHIIMSKLAFTWFTVAITAASVIYFSHAADRYSRLWLGCTLIISLLLVAASRIIIQFLLRRIKPKGGVRRPVFLIGPGEQVVQVAKGMRSSPAEGYSIAGVERISGVAQHVCFERVARRVTETGAREVWICVPLEMGSIVRRIFHALRNQTAEVRFIPDFKDMHLLNHQFSEVAGHLAIDLSVSPLDGLAHFMKRLEDIVLGILISLLILPLCICIALMIKLTSPGPVLFKQYRTGANGQKFKVYKFRSMVLHQEVLGQVTQANRNDPRVTYIGAFLRRTSLDELPQFYNVLQGRMSIVGPRPHALAHNEYFKEIVESYMKRHKVKPGITGWAQVNGLRGETDTIEKMKSRVDYDLWYIDSWSIGLDLRIIFLTTLKGFVGKNVY